MILRTLLPACSATALALAVFSTHAATPDCTDVAGWNAGRHGQVADSACTDETYAEAFRLGEALADLQTRHAALEARIAKQPDDAGALQRQQRQIAVDIEAIHGVATLRNWPTRIPDGVETR